MKRPIPIAYRPDISEYEYLFDYYYSKCPGSVLPFLLLYLAKENQVKVLGKSRKIEYDTEEKKYGGYILSQFDMDDLKELALTDSASQHLVAELRRREQKQLSLMLTYKNSDNDSGGSIGEIRRILQKHDDGLISNMEQRKALFTLALGLTRADKRVLENRFLDLFSLLVEKSGIYSGSENLEISAIEACLVDGLKGNGYIPFSRLSFVSTMLPSVNMTLEFSGKEKGTPELFSALSELLALGKGDALVTCKITEDAFESLEADAVYDLFIMNHVSPMGEYKQTRFSSTLQKVFTHMSANGVYVGLDRATDFFNTSCTGYTFLNEVVKKGKLDCIILLPKQYNSVLVVIRNDKTDREIRLVDLFNHRPPKNFLGHPADLKTFLRTHARFITLEELKKKDFLVGEYFRYNIPDAPEGMETIPLRNFLSRIEKVSSAFSLSEPGFDYDNLDEIVLSAQDEYDPRNSEIESVPLRKKGFFDSVYLIEDDSIIMKSQGNLEPRFFEYYGVETILRDGLAFRVKTDRGGEYNRYAKYIINELQKDYVYEQLHDWTNNSDGIHSEEEVLSIRIHCPMRHGRHDLAAMENICDKELNANTLPVGFEIDNQDSRFHERYTIESFLGEGCFGLTYKALRTDALRDDPQPVAIKEFFVKLTARSKRNKDYSVTQDIGTIDSFRRRRDFSAEKARFIEEADKMKRFGSVPDSHIRKALKVFSSEKTNNLYFVMNLCDNGDLDSFIGLHAPLEEKEAIERFIIPISKALNVLHNGRCVHLDLKPENIMIDNDGLALVSDLGNSKLYYEDGTECSYGQYPSSSEYAPPEECDLSVVRRFHPELDIYALGCIYYQILTGIAPSREYDLDLTALDSDGISEGSRKAICGAVEKDLRKRTHSIMDFVHALPGYETADFTIQDVIPEDEDSDDDFDFDFNIPEDIEDEAE